MRRSFLTAVLVAPLVVPVICTGVFALYLLAGMGLLNALPAILIVAVVLFGSSYGATIVIGAPIVFFASRWMRINAIVVLAAGALAAAIAYLPLAWFAYQTTGNNSGPPDPISPLQFLHWAFAGAAVPFFVCILVGLITAAIFYFLSGLQTKHDETIPAQTVN
jgi:TRAP-type C4-dicarboxylate transport system permease small subunit